MRRRLPCAEIGAEAHPRAACTCLPLPPAGPGAGTRRPRGSVRPRAPRRRRRRRRVARRVPRCPVCARPARPTAQAPPPGHAHAAGPRPVPEGARCASRPATPPGPPPKEAPPPPEPLPGDWRSRRQATPTARGPAPSPRKDPSAHQPPFWPRPRREAPPQDDLRISRTATPLGPPRAEAPPHGSARGAAQPPDRPRPQHEVVAPPCAAGSPRPYGVTTPTESLSPAPCRSARRFLKGPRPRQAPPRPALGSPSSGALSSWGLDEPQTGQWGGRCPPVSPGQPQGTGEGHAGGPGPLQWVSQPAQPSRPYSSPLPSPGSRPLWGTSCLALPKYPPACTLKPASGHSRTPGVPWPLSLPVHTAGCRVNALQPHTQVCVHAGHACCPCVCKAGMILTPKERRARAWPTLGHPWPGLEAQVAHWMNEGTPKGTCLAVGTGPAVRMGWAVSTCCLSKPTIGPPYAPWPR